MEKDNTLEINDCWEWQPSAHVVLNGMVAWKDRWVVVWMDGKVNSFDGWLNRFLVGMDQWLDDWLAELIYGWID
jgi:hypothetical protein